MSVFPVISRLRNFGRDSQGGVLVEFAVVVALFIFLFFTLIDFGRLAYTVVLAENASAIAARTAIVRPAACAGVPDRHVRGTADPPPRFGTSCRSQAGTCLAIATVTCAGVATNPTALEVWNRVQDLLPPDAVIGNLEFSYSSDPNLGFLGGPFTPMVTVELNLAPFQFVSPLGQLAAAAGGTGNIGTSTNLQSFSVSMPGEDLNMGEGG